MALPDFLVIGAQRAGTTWLDGVLRSHPEIYLPTRRKEVHFFDAFYDRGTDWYSRFFPDGDEARTYGAIGEITPKYLYDPDVPDRIHATLPGCRLIAVLRDPVARAYSQYGLSIRDTGETRSFKDYLATHAEVVDRGRYAEQLARYLKIWPRDRILILIFEEMLKERVAALATIASFLGVAQCRFGTPQEAVNASYVPRFPRARAAARRVSWMLRQQDLDWPIRVAKRLGVSRLFGRRGRVPPISHVDREQLIAVYTPETTRLERMLGLDLSVWREAWRAG